VEVIRVEVYNKYPIPSMDFNYSSDRMTNTPNDIQPLEILQSQSLSFQVNGHQVS
jgi:Cu2+-containing amine oxidase